MHKRSWNETFCGIQITCRATRWTYWRQFMQAEFNRYWYKTTTTETYGYSMIDLYAKTNDSLRFCSNVVGLGATVFSVVFFDKGNIAAKWTKNTRIHGLLLRRKVNPTGSFCASILIDLISLCECSLAEYNQWKYAVWCHCFLCVSLRSWLKLFCDSNNYTEKQQKSFCTTKAIKLLRQIIRPIKS